MLIIMVFLQNHYKYRFTLMNKRGKCRNTIFRLKIALIWSKDNGYINAMYACSKVIFIYEISRQFFLGAMLQTFDNQSRFFKIQEVLLQFVAENFSKDTDHISLRYNAICQIAQTLNRFRRKSIQTKSQLRIYIFFHHKE